MSSPISSTTVICSFFCNCRMRAKVACRESKKQASWRTFVNPKSAWGLVNLRSACSQFNSRSTWDRISATPKSLVLENCCHPRYNDLHIISFLVCFRLWSLGEDICGSMPSSYKVVLKNFEFPWSQGCCVVNVECSKLVRAKQCVVNVECSKLVRAKQCVVTVEFPSDYTMSSECGMSV